MKFLEIGSENIHECLFPSQKFNLCFEKNRCSSKHCSFGSNALRCSISSQEKQKNLLRLLLPVGLGNEKEVRFNFQHFCNFFKVIERNRSLRPFDTSYKIGCEFRLPRKLFLRKIRLCPILPNVVSQYAPNFHTAKIAKPAYKSCGL